MYLFVVFSLAYARKITIVCCGSLGLLKKWRWNTLGQKHYFLTFPADFWIPIFFSNFNSNLYNSIDMRNLQEQIKKAFCYQKLFWTFTVRTNCSSDLNSFLQFLSLQSRISKILSQSLEQFFLTVGQDNFGNKIS